MPHLDDLTIRIYPETLLNNILDINGSFYRQLPNGNFCKADISGLPLGEVFITVNWLELPESLRIMYVEENWPDIKLEDYFILIHGKEKGQELIDDLHWALNNTVYTDEITLEIKAKIGKRFNNIKELGSGYCFPNDTDFDNSKWYQYLIDDRWIVTITEHSNPFKNLDYDMLPKKAAVLMEKFDELADVTITIVDLSK